MREIHIIRDQRPHDEFDFYYWTREDALNGLEYIKAHMTKRELAKANFLYEVRMVEYEDGMTPDDAAREDEDLFLTDERIVSQEDM